MRRPLPLWMQPLVGVVIYPGLILFFGRAISEHHQSGSALWALAALLTMLLAMSIPALAIRALMMMRQDERGVLTRAILYLMFAAPSLFTLSYSLTRVAGVDQYLSALWISLWTVVGVMLYFRQGRTTPVSQPSDVTWLRAIHGGTALCVLCGFLIAHVINHDLAVWSVALHGTVMKFLRLWYRSEWVQPVLLTLLLIMLATGVPMVLHHSRQRTDAFRVVQMATGVYIGVFLCSHVFAVLNGRRMGIETDWSFAAGPTSLLDGKYLRARLIPHYIFIVFFLTLHVACGLRIVLLHHGVTKLIANRILYGLAAAGVVVTALSAAALLGLHVQVTH